MAGLLGDVLPFLYSQGDRAKRYVGGLLGDPMGTITREVNNGNDRAGAMLGLLGQAANEGMNYGPATQKMAGMLADAYNPVAATVWHGSPHKFNKFDSSKIGTGEGAQAYGHGLYLAESPAVAQTYKSAGADPSTFVTVRSIRDPAQMAATALERAGGDIRHATAVLSQNAQSGDITAGAALQLLKQRAALPESKYAGNLYKVDLPDETIGRMLDWDKPLSQQAPEVQKAIQRTKAMLPPNAMDDLGGDLSMLYGRDVGADSFLGTMNSLRPNIGEELLRKAGVPGVKYLDGGSRGAGTGTRNYVVFPGNESLLTILERNGLPLP